MNMLKRCVFLFVIMSGCIASDSNVSQNTVTKSDSVAADFGEKLAKAIESKKTFTSTQHCLKSIKIAAVNVGLQESVVTSVFGEEVENKPFDDQLIKEWAAKARSIK